MQLPEPGVASYFLSLFGRSDRVTACACERMGEVTLPQLLHLQNGDDLPRKIRSTDGRLTSLLEEKNDDKVMEEIFLATVSRLPRAGEVKAVRESLATGDAREDKGLLIASLVTYCTRKERGHGRHDVSLAGACEEFIVGHDFALGGCQVACH